MPGSKDIFDVIDNAVFYTSSEWNDLKSVLDLLFGLELITDSELNHWEMLRTGKGVMVYAFRKGGPQSNNLKRLEFSELDNLDE